jgi:NAD+ kinase
MSSFRSVGLITKRGDLQVAKTLEVIRNHLRERGLMVYLDASAADFVSPAPTAKLTEMGECCDLAIVVGGDGTLLAAARELAGRSVPIVGVNLGHLGFLVDVPPDDQLTLLDEILNGQYREETRFLLECRAFRRGECIHQNIALNDLTMRIKDAVRMIEFETYINGIFVNVQRADGLIVSTPTGSTAYALSSGGPILSPTLDAMIILPICPHTLSSRPIVVDANSDIEVRFCESNREPGQLVSDGQDSVTVVEGDSLQIRRAERTVSLLHPCNYDFYHILREKLGWR